MNLTSDHPSTPIPKITRLQAIALDEPYALKSELQELINTVPTVVWRADPTGLVEFFNRHFYEYTGLSPEDACGNGWQAVIHPQDLPKAMRHRRKVLASGQSGELEVRMRRFDGEYRWFVVRAVPKRNQQGEIVNWYGNNNEIQNRKQTELDFRQGEAELQPVIDTIGQMVLFLSHDGSTLHANRFMLDYCGVSPEDVKADNFRSRVFHPEDIERLSEKRDRALSQNLPFENEQRIRRGDGKYRWFFIRYTPLLGPQGDSLRWYCVGFDIEERKQAEESTRNEIVALREDIIHSSMFEEIIGSSQFCAEPFLK